MSLRILSKTSPASSSEEDVNEFSANGNNTQLSRFNTDENTQPILRMSPPVKKEPKMEEISADGCAAIDLEELLAQTYPKEISTPIAKSNEVTAEGSVRRSKRAKTSISAKTPERSTDSSKKWSSEEEICLSRILLECTSPEGEANIAAFYIRAKEALQFEVSSKQLYDKIRNMKARFLALKSKLKRQNISEENYVYKHPHEPALLAIWKRLWENNNIVPNIKAGNPKSSMNLRNSGIPVELDCENHGDEARRATTGDDSGEYLQEEEDFQTLMQNASENGGRKPTQGERKGLQSNNIDGFTTNLKPSGGFNGGVQVGACVIPIVLGRMKELADAVNSVEEYPYLDAVQARQLQRKWRRFRIRQVRLFSEGLGLLNEQCKLMLESLEASKGS